MATMRIYPPGTSDQDDGAYQLPPNTISGGAGISGITVQNQGVTVGTPAGITTVNFVGGEVTATGAGAIATATIPAVFPGAGNYGLVLATHMGYVRR